MKFWFTHNSALSLQLQIVEQVRLALASGELKPREKLPSVRTVGRMHGIHANTVSAAYQQLEREGVLRHARGGGTYVQEQPASALKHDFRTIIAAMRRDGLTDDEITARFRAAMTPSRGWLLVEPEAEAARLVRFELQEAGVENVALCSLEPEQYHMLPQHLGGRTPLALPRRMAAVRAALGDGVDTVPLTISTVAELLAEALPSTRDHLVAVVSHWPRFLELSRAMLLASGFHADSIECRDARQHDWQRGLQQADAVVCDSYTHSILSPGLRAKVFPLVSRQTLQQLSGKQ